MNIYLKSKKVDKIYTLIYNVYGTSKNLILNQPRMADFLNSGVIIS